MCSSKQSNQPAQLRPFLPEDFRQVRSLVESVLAEFGFGLGGHDDDWDIEDLAGFYAPPTSVFLVLETGGEVVGTVGVKRRSDAEAELRRMYLKPHLRGGGQGEKMLSAALDFARSRDYNKIFLQTSDKFKKAIKLYESAGFALTDRRGEHCHLVYEKSLESNER